MVNVGFVGIGVMGQPMALNLQRAGVPLLVWSRRPERCDPVMQAGARRVDSLDELFAACETVILMLLDERAMDEVLGRGSPDFRARVAGRLLVSMGTFSTTYSAQLAAEVVADGGRYVEAPVSGSRKPAEAGQLVGMVAGDPPEVARVRALIAPMCKETFDCGPVPNGLMMKLAVNVFLIALVTGLAEATHFARAHGVDMRQFNAIVDAGPMASVVSQTKLRKLVEEDFAVQASIADVRKNARLVVEQALASRVATPLLRRCLELYAHTEALGAGALDMVAVVKAYEALTGELHH